MITRKNYCDTCKLYYDMGQSEGHVCQRRAVIDFTGAACWPEPVRSHASLGLDRHDALDTAGLDEDELALLRGLIALMRGRKGKN
jgi:hypothetical protein